jgi:hypothetical protein
MIAWVYQQNRAMIRGIGEWYPGGKCNFRFPDLARQKDEVIEEWDADGHYQETMSFISDFWGALTYLQRKREELKSPDRNNYPHPLEAYLKGMGQTNY